MRAVSAKRYQAIQLQIFIGFFHGGNLVHAVGLYDTHVAKGPAAGAKDGSAQRKNAGELLFGHFLIFAVNQSTVTVTDADNFRVKHFIGGTGHAADGRVQSRAVAAAGENTNSALHK